MSALEVARLAAVALGSALATRVLARLAERHGITDAPAGDEAARKLQGRGVPAVGGAALLLGLAWAPRGGLARGADFLWARWLPSVPWLAVTLALLFAAGALDDRRRLAPGPKALAQLAALLPLGAGALAAGAPPAGAAALVCAGFVAVNALNTFDNADGALASLCALAFVPVAPFAAAAVLGFLPWNLDAHAARNRASGAPTAYLGDAGAFVLAFLVLLHPRAAGALVLPLLDLARLSVVRVRAGSRPWRGDRRHLAHRLAARGLGPVAVAGLQCVLAAPAVAGVAFGTTLGALAGAAATASLLALALRAAPEPGPTA